MTRYTPVGYGLLMRYKVVATKTRALGLFSQHVNLQLQFYSVLLIQNLEIGLTHHFAMYQFVTTRKAPLVPSNDQHWWQYWLKPPFPFSFDIRDRIQYLSIVWTPSLTMILPKLRYPHTDMALYCPSRTVQDTSLHPSSPHRSPWRYCLEYYTEPEQSWVGSPSRSSTCSRD
jgi:hypothetical protein